MKTTKHLKNFILLFTFFATWQIQAQDDSVNYSFADMYNYNKLTETEKVTIEQESNDFLAQKQASDDEGEIEQLNWEIYRRCHRHLLAEDEVNYIIQQLKIVENEVSKTRKKPTKWINKNEE